MGCDVEALGREAAAANSDGTTTGRAGGGMHAAVVARSEEAGSGALPSAGVAAAPLLVAMTDTSGRRAQALSTIVASSRAVSSS